MKYLKIKPICADFIRFSFKIKTNYKTNVIKNNNLKLMCFDGLLIAIGSINMIVL